MGNPLALSSGNATYTSSYPITQFIPKSPVSFNKKSSGRDYSFLPNQIAKKIPIPSTISNLPNEYNISKVEVFHPIRGWEKVSLRDIRYLQDRKVSDEDLTQILKANLSVEDAVKMAKGFPEKQGEKLVKSIIKSASVYLAQKSQGLGFCGYIRKYYESLFTYSGIPNQIPIEETMNTKVIEMSDEFVSLKGSRWDGTMLDAVTSSRKLISSDDYALFQENGLTDEHLESLTQKGIESQFVLVYVKMFPSLEGEELFNRIADAAIKLPETKAFKKWVKNPLKGCSKDGIKGMENYPKALILKARNYDSMRSTRDTYYQQEILKKLDRVYNLCQRSFHDLDSFFKALSQSITDQPFKMAVVMAHGQPRSLKFDENSIVSMEQLKRHKSIIGSIFSKILAPDAHFIWLSCSTGKGKANIADFFYQNSPSGVKVFAPKEDYNNIQVILWRDTEGSIRANFWTYDLNADAISNCVKDITYTIDSSKS